MIEITVNGKQREIDDGLDITGLLQALAIDARAVAVARNGEVVRRDAYKETALREGDSVEIVRMVGGG